MKLLGALVAALAAACGPGANHNLTCADGGVEAELGTVDTSQGFASESPLGHNKFFEVAINADVRPDVLDIELYGGVGPFGPPGTGVVRPGTFDLSGREGAFDTCGACILIRANVDEATNKGDAYYMPVSGRIVVTQAVDRLIGELDDVVFQHVDIDFLDPDGAGPLQPSLKTTPIDDGCQVHLAKAAFSDQYLPDDAGTSD